MEFKPRATYIQIRDLALIAVYQPVRTHGKEANEEYRYDLVDLLARCPGEKLLVIGGDHNSQIGRTETKSSLETATNEQGHDLLTGVMKTAWNGSTALQEIAAGNLVSQGSGKMV